MKAFTKLSGDILVLEQQNIDTDQIIPARFLTTTSFEGLGDHLFADWRYDGEGKERPDSVLNQPRAKQSPILVAGRNFGCGSSREHAPHALLDFGFRVVISSEIADIFRNNSQNVGLLPVVLPEDQHRHLMGLDGQTITVDLESCTILVQGSHDNDVIYHFEIDGFARYCLLNGMDRLDFLLAEQSAIEVHELAHKKIHGACTPSRRY
ncbi:MAG: 3-isopropylmalate/(R)-2-methylmalate dehydratase small subunit [Rhodothermales bacterium]|jgi:3-isopropylmalate/(R)-2-methylmalate dehydratase small subunit